MSRPTVYKALTSWKDNRLHSLCSSDTLEEGENMFWPQTAWTFRSRSFFTYAHISHRVFHGTKSFPVNSCARCSLNLPISMLLVADTRVAALLELLLQLWKDLGNKGRK